MIFAVAMVSCNSSTHPDEVPAPGVTAAFDNIPWVGNSKLQAYFQLAGAGGPQSLFVSVTDSPPTQVFSFSVRAPSAFTALTPGTYRVSDRTTDAGFSKNFGNYSTSWSPGSGTLTLNSISTTAKTATGTFTYVVVDQTGTVSHSITNGKFNVSFEIIQ